MKTNSFKKISMAGVAIVIALLASVMVGCQKEETFESQAEQIVKSHEYQAMAYEANTFGSALNSNYLRLSQSDKEEFKKKINYLLTENFEDIDEVDKLLDELKSVINIDIKMQINNLQKSALNLPNMTGISPRELIIAGQKHIKFNNSSIPRLKSGAENANDIPRDPECVALCAAIYVGEIALCTLLPPVANALCFSLATVAYADCIVGCEI
jgi:hypothetical protein